MLRVLRSKWLSMGPEVQAFESEMSDFLGIKHAFAVSSGTAALHLAYLALGIGAGDEVIQPAINFVAAANTTVAVGATPVFADIVGLDEPTIDPEAVERLLTPRTRAVVVMHYGWLPGQAGPAHRALRTPSSGARRRCVPCGRCSLSRSEPTAAARRSGRHGRGRRLLLLLQQQEHGDG